MAIHRLDLSPSVDVVVGSSVVFITSVGFAVSKRVRCTAMLMLPSMFTKEGRLWLSTLTYELILTGMLLLCSVVCQ